MSFFTINVTQIDTTSSIINIVDKVTDCKSGKSFTLNIPSNESKYVTIITSGTLASYTGQTELVFNTTNYTLTVDGDNTNTDDNTFSGTVIFNVRDKKGGTIEHQIILSRTHNNTTC